MSESLGKKFEQKFAEDWKKSFPNTFLYRLHDQVSGYKVVSRNPSDWIAFTNDKLWLLECKETKESTFNFSKLTQYEAMVSYVKLKNVNPYVIIWFSNYDKVIAVHIGEIKKMKEDTQKSISIKAIIAGNFNYNIVDIPSIKKRVFLDSDYTVLIK